MCSLQQMSAKYVTRYKMTFIPRVKRNLSVPEGEVQRFMFDIIIQLF